VRSKGKEGIVEEQRKERKLVISRGKRAKGDGQREERE
jgi:hypothetical protein